MKMFGGAQGNSEPVPDPEPGFDSKRRQFIQRSKGTSPASEQDREHLRKMALPRLIVVWFNAWECTSAEDTWARCEAGQHVYILMRMGPLRLCLTQSDVSITTGAVSFARLLASWRLICRGLIVF